jgi:hypothetical protein
MRRKRRELILACNKRVNREISKAVDIHTRLEDARYVQMDENNER